MPVVSSVDAAGAFLATRLYGRVSGEDLIADQKEAAALLSRDSAFCTLLLFDPTVDLSTIDAGTARTVRQHRKQQLAELGLRRKAGAAVVGSARDAELMLPLWNALSDSDPDFEIRFEVFYSIQPSLDWLGIDVAVGRQVIAQTGYSLLA